MITPLSVMHTLPSVMETCFSRWHGASKRRCMLAADAPPLPATFATCLPVDLHILFVPSALGSSTRARYVS